MTDLPVAERWFRTEEVTEEIALLVEDHLDVFFESNIWHVRGRDRDLVVDSGNGIGVSVERLTPLVEGRPIVAVATHDHFDHIGGMHAFEERWCHAADAEGLRAPEGLALHRRDYRPGLEEEIRWYGYEPPEIVIKALPAPTFDVGAWRTPPTEPTRVLADGDLVDPGDRAFEVLHVPGTPRARSRSGTPIPGCSSRATPQLSTILCTPRTRRRSWRRSSGSRGCLSSSSARGTPGRSGGTSSGS